MTDLAQAFLEAPDVRPDLEAAILARARNAERRRRAVLLGSAATGLGLALGAMGAADLLRADALRALATLALEPWMAAVLGVALTTVIAWREGLADF